MNSIKHDIFGLVDRTSKGVISVDFGWVFYKSAISKMRLYDIQSQITQRPQVGYMKIYSLGVDIVFGCRLTTPNLINDVVTTYPYWS